MTINIFLKEYRLALLEKILFDKDLKFTLLYKDQLFNYEKGFTYPNGGTKIKKKILKKSDLNEYISHSSSYWNFSQKTEHYIITEKLIDSVKNTQSIFEYFSKATGVIWSDELLEKYKDKWNWNSLSENNSICWNEKRINKFSNILNFNKLSENVNIKLNFSLLKNYENKWDWNKISSNPIIIKELGTEILNHKRIIWIAQPYTTKPIMNYNEPFWDFIPCICTNKGIEWTLELFEFYKNKIDFWLLALNGKLDNTIIEKYGAELDENRIVCTHNTKCSDFRDAHPWYRNGWENIFENPNFYFNKNIYNSIRVRKGCRQVKEIDLIRYSGDAQYGHKEYILKKKISHLINPERLNFDFKQLVNYSYILSPKLISKTYIHQSIFDKIIKPELLNDEKLIYKIFERFNYY